MLKISICFMVFMAVSLGIFPFLRYFNALFNGFFFYAVFFGNKNDFLIFKKTMPYFQYAWLAVAVLVTGFLLALGLYLLLIPLFLALLFAPSFLVRESVAAWKRRIRSQMPGLCNSLANTTRAGLAIEKGFQEVARDLPTPIREEVRLIVGNYHAGMDFRRCLEETKKTIEIPVFSLFVAAIQTCKDRGGPINLTLEKLGESVREMERLERTMETATATGKKSIQFLSFFPFGFLLLLLALYDGTIYMFTTILGQLLILLSMAIVAFANYWAYIIAKSDF